MSFRAKKRSKVPSKSDCFLIIIFFPIYWPLTTLAKFDILFLLKTSWSTRYAGEIMAVESCSFRDVAKGKGVGGSGIPMTPTFASLLLENKCNRWWNWHDNLVNILNLTQCDPPSSPFSWLRLCLLVIKLKINVWQRFTCSNDCAECYYLWRHVLAVPRFSIGTNPAKEEFSSGSAEFRSISFIVFCTFP